MSLPVTSKFSSIYVKKDEYNNKLLHEYHIVILKSTIILVDILSLLPGRHLSSAKILLTPACASLFGTR